MPPMVAYPSPQSVVAGGNLTVTPSSATDNGTITGYNVQGTGGYTGGISVNSSGVRDGSRAGEIATSVPQTGVSVPHHATFGCVVPS